MRSVAKGGLVRRDLMACTERYFSHSAPSQRRERRRTKIENEKISLRNEYRKAFEHLGGIIVAEVVLR